MEYEAALFKVLADPTRLRLAVLLSIQGETCVCVLAEALEEPDFKVSRHLGIMRSAGMVKARREGTWMHYKLVEPRTDLEKCLQECFRDCLVDHKTITADLKRLKKVTCPPGLGGRKLRVIFLCTGNSCRSQMAEDWARHQKGDVVEPILAGINKHGLGGEGTSGTENEFDQIRRSQDER